MRIEEIGKSGAKSNTGRDDTVTQCCWPHRVSRLLQAIVNPTHLYAGLAEPRVHGARSGPASLHRATSRPTLANPSQSLPVTCLTFVCQSKLISVDDAVEPC